MLVHNVEQNSKEWYDLRCGMPTASRIKELFTAANKVPKDVTKTMLTYAAELAADTVAGFPLSQEEGFQGNYATQRGHDLEGAARDEYTFIANAEVTQIGYVTDDDQIVGCSPDSLVGSNGLLEIKCLLAKAHTLALADIAERICPRDYYVQCQVQTWICERQWCDLYFYHPTLASAVWRVDADKEFHALIDQQVNLICDQRDKLALALRRAA